MNHSMNDIALPMMILKPAELRVRTTPTIINTTVGPCLAVTMFSDAERIIAIISDRFAISAGRDKRRKGDRFGADIM